jgi:ATP-dependent Clp protease ATP-binding subunit ClpC
VFEHFTEPARQDVLASQDEALSLGYDFIGTEHLLLGLVGTSGGTAAEVLVERGLALDRVREEVVRLLEAAGVPATGGQPAKDALATIGISAEEIQRRADESFGAGAFQFPRPAYTPRAKKALTLAVGEAQALGNDHIGTEHMLLGLLAEGEGLAMRVLTGLGVDVEALRPAVLSRVGPGAS